MTIESWIDISSQPSSPPHSLGNTTTTGFPVEKKEHSCERKSALGNEIPILSDDAAHFSNIQEEYEESDSDDEEILDSSTENVIIAKSQETMPVYDAESNLDMGRSTSASLFFTPQPNAFSHPPSNQRHRSVRNNLTSNTLSNVHGHPARYQRRQSSYGEPTDHDAALRASLTTLLSIGAGAARSLPKRETVTARGIQKHNEPIGLRFVSEAELMALPSSPISHTSTPPSSNVKSNRHRSPDIGLLEKRKRKLKTSEKAKPSKLLAGIQDDMLNPTLFTWAVSAGVLVLISVVGFGAGYVIGREVGRQEVATGLNSSALADGSCGKDFFKRSSNGLMRFRWSMGGNCKSVAN
ncbi:Bgt-2636 [Blumeria graminis f. sp. tritici]|uniref:Bgt-2636 n=2 Tax=Blumeria graminis f. sp. tritici TaxID=62690 RepID=A0A061HIV2_BLUGR|nr:hypothetical protein BGT96224_2636 [Blumeria graminis f. sp. tritici 96224]VDB93630.1 Bgt-2636 [Blumeria graminis f. sp. tritici]